MIEAEAQAEQTLTAVEEASAPTTESIQENNTTPLAEVDLAQGGSGEVVETQSQPPAPTLESRISNASDVSEYEALMAEAQSNPQMFEEPPAEESSEEAQAPVIEDVAEGSPEVTTTEEGEAPPEVVEGEDTSNGEEQAKEGDKPPQFRFRPSDKVDAEAFRIYKAAEIAQAPVSMSDAIGIARTKLGVQEQPAQNQDQTAQAEGDDSVSEDPIASVTSEETKAEIRNLRKEQSQALRDGDLDAAADFADQLVETEDLLELVSVRESQEIEQNTKKQDQEFNSSVSKAGELFPDFNEEGGAFYERCQEIDEALKDTGDPRYFEAGKPLMIAQMAARELNVAPNSGNRTPVPATKAPQVAVANETPQQQAASPQPPRTEKPGQLPAASGASRTGSNPSGSAVTLAQQVDSVSSPDDFEKLASAVHQNIRVR
jgi:hypothetical protein